MNRGARGSGIISPYSGRDIVKSLRPSYTGLYPQSHRLRGGGVRRPCWSQSRSRSQRGDRHTRRGRPSWGQSRSRSERGDKQTHGLALKGETWETKGRQTLKGETKGRQTHPHGTRAKELRDAIISAPATRYALSPAIDRPSQRLDLRSLSLPHSG